MILKVLGHGASRFTHADWSLGTVLAVCCLQENVQITNDFKGFPEAMLPVPARSGGPPVAENRAGRLLSTGKCSNFLRF